MRTIKECKKLIFAVAVRLGVSPRIIMTECLTADDKKDIESGEITLDALILHIKYWLETKRQEKV